MLNLIDVLNFGVVVSGITIAILGLILSIRAQYMDREAKGFFFGIFFVMILYILSDLIGQLSIIYLKDGAALTKAETFLESFFSSLLMPMVTVYMLRQCGQKVRGRHFNIVMLLWAVYIVLLIITQFTTFIYYITEDNVYRRGPCYQVLLVPPVLIMLFNLVGFYRKRKQLSPKQRSALWAYLGIPLVSMVLQMAFYGIYLIILGTSISALVMFMYILDDQLDKGVKQTVELKEQQMKIRFLQIRPHFIYNTLSNIYYLCEMDPKKAQKVVGDFTTYLRDNFSASAKQDMIPFTKELEHTRAYLEVVKARYEDQLSVEFDTDYTDFRVPPLTLEPIAENAVKHGLDPELSPLQLSIQTVEAPEGARIIVKDNGPGFSEEQEEDDGREHVGLQNVRARLHALCGGSLEITENPGGGLIVTLLVPQRSGKEDR